MPIVQRLLVLFPDADEEVLSNIQDIVEDEFKSYTHQTTIPSNAEGVLMEMALVRFNTMGNEGLTSSSYGDVSESYSDRYNDTIMKQLMAYRKVQML